MRAIKIPEGPAFDDDELSITFEMGGNELVTDVDAGITVGGDDDPENYDLQCRLISPIGTTSTWKNMDIATGGVYIPKLHIPFSYEFDNENSSGKWKLQLRDPVQDDDGRARFRNATLRINDGESTTIRGLADDTSETVTLTGAQSRFDVLPEVNAGPFTGDFAVYGVKVMLRNDFTFVTSFSVRSLNVNFSLACNDGTDPENRCLLLIMSPSGGYTASGLGEPLASVDQGTGKLNNYSISLSESILAEPSLGTWTVAIVDTQKDSNTIQLVPNGPVSVAMVISIQPTPLTLTLNGRLY
jgi:subtilisin-like proprotein convertase family protein